MKWYIATKNARYFSSFEADGDDAATRKIAALQAACSDPTVTFAWESMDALLVHVPTGTIRQVAERRD